jgi:hypothetical protein
MRLFGSILDLLIGNDIAESIIDVEEFGRRGISRKALL